MNGLFFGNLASGPQGEVEPKLPSEYQRCEWVSTDVPTGNGYRVDDDSNEPFIIEGRFQYTSNSTGSVWSRTAISKMFGMQNTEVHLKYSGYYYVEANNESWYHTKVIQENGNVSGFFNDELVINGKSTTIPYVNILYKFSKGRFDFVRFKNHLVVACYRRLDNVSGLFDFYDNSFFEILGGYHGNDK